jgi:hypothetical protein
VTSGISLRSTTFRQSSAVAIERWRRTLVALVTTIGGLSAVAAQESDRRVLSDADFVAALAKKELAPLAIDFLRHREKAGKLPLEPRIARILAGEGLASEGVAYLEKLQARKDLPADVAAVLDYEIASTMIRQAETADAETERQLEDKAVVRLRKFLASKTDGEEAIDARNDIASLSLKRAQRMIARSEVEKDAKAKANLRTDARKLLLEARNDLGEAITQYQEAIASLEETDEAKPVRKSARKRVIRRRSGDDPKARLESAMLTAKLNEALCFFHAGRTYDKGDGKRTSELTEALGKFDAIFQKYRSVGSILPTYAHFWSARTYQELDDHRAALDVLEEVLSAEPPKGTRVGRDIRTLFGETHLAMYQSWIIRKEPDRVLSDSAFSATQWVRDHAEERGQPHYIGIQLILARLELAAADAEKEEGKRRVGVLRALERLNKEVLQTRSSYSGEAFALRDKYGDFVKAAMGKANDLAEAIFLAGTMVDAGKYADAATALEEALSKAGDKAKPDDLQAAKTRLTQAYVRAGRLDDAIKSADEFLKSFPQSKSAAEVAGMGLNARYGRFAKFAGGAAQVGAEAGKVIDYAAYIEKTWPTVVQADLARQIRAVALLRTRRFVDSAEAFGSVRESSPVYADAQFRAAQAWWNAYANAVNAARPNPASGAAGVAKSPAGPGAGKSPAECAAGARAAIDRAVKALTKGQAEGAAWSPAVVEAKALDAEIVLRTQGAAKAGPLVDPLLEIARSGKGAEPAAIQRILTISLETAIGNRDLTKADAILNDVLKAIGADASKLTRILIDLGRGIETEMKTLEAAGRKDEAAKSRELFTSFLDRLSGKDLAFASRYYIAESYYTLAIHDRAADAFEKLAGQFDDEAKLPENYRGDANKATRERELSKIKARRAASLRLSGKTDAMATALALIDDALKEHEQAKRTTYPLVYLMERARILQAYGAADPAKLLDALKQWNAISTRLASSPNKPKEYFESRLAIAECLEAQGKKDQAKQIVQRTMTLNPACGGPELKAKFDDALVRLGG